LKFQAQSTGAVIVIDIGALYFCQCCYD